MGSIENEETVAAERHDDQSGTQHEETAGTHEWVGVPCCVRELLPIRLQGGGAGAGGGEQPGSARVDDDGNAAGDELPDECPQLVRPEAWRQAS